MVRTQQREHVMRIAVLGTGTVGRQLAKDFAERGHSVTVGTRDPAATRSRDIGDGMLIGEWLDAHPEITLTALPGAAADADLVVNATMGAASLEALTALGAGALDGRVVLDVSNPLDFSAGFPPTLSVKDTDSLAETLQRAFPAARFVKGLNMLGGPLMLHPEALSEPTTLFVAGDDSDAKATVVGLLEEFGWRDVIDLGPLASARGMEMWLPLWLRIMGALGNPMFSLRIVR
jgi:predicted dinucleotide-binding enzyme